MAVSSKMVLNVVADKPKKRTLKSPPGRQGQAAHRAATQIGLSAKHEALTDPGVSSANTETIRHTMIPDRDIYRIAIAMLEKYGASASTYAELEAEILLDEGEEAKFRTWLRILVAMEELQDVPASTTLH